MRMMRMRMIRMIMLGWMESTVVVYNRQFPITGTVPIFFFLMQCSRIQGTEREYKCRLMQCATSFMHLLNIQSGRDRVLPRLWVVQVSRYSPAKRDKID